MKFSIKKLIATTLAAAALAGGSVIGASAYATSSDWNVYYNPYQVRDSQTLIVVTHGNGYKAEMTGRSGGTVNRVVLRCGSIEPVNGESEINRTIDTLNTPLEFSYKLSLNPYISVEVDFEYANGTYYSNQGTFSIR